MKKVHMTLVARMTQEPVASRSVWTTGMHAQNWTIGQFAMWLAHVGEVGRMVAGEPVGVASAQPSSNLSNSWAIGVCVSC